MIDSTQQKYYAEHRDKRFPFSGRTGFMCWLHDTAEYVLEFEDNQQDCLTWYVDAGGEILHADMQSTIWNGRIVDLDTIEEGKRPQLLDVENQRNIIYSHAVEAITPIEEFPGDPRA